MNTLANRRTTRFDSQLRAASAAARVHRRAAALLTSALLLGASVLGAGATAQAAEPAAYPSRPVTIVVPFSAGGPTDLVGRVVARSFEKATGQTFLVENAGGAGATLGTGKVAAAPADGSVLLLGSSSALVIAPHLYTSLKYDTFNSFEPIGKVAGSSYVVMVRAGAPYQTWPQLIAWAKAHPGELNYASPGVGSSLHLTIQQMLDLSKVSATHIPFTGTAQAWTALLGGSVDLLIDSPSGAVPMVKSAKAVPLAVTSRDRIPELPDVPTLQELGLRNFESLAWFALLAPKGTPPATIATLQRMLVASLQTPEVRSVLVGAGFVPSAEPPQALAAQIRREYDHWAEVIQKTGLRLDK